VADVEQRISRWIEERAYPAAVFNLVKRRIDRVYKYLTDEG